MMRRAVPWQSAFVWSVLGVGCGKRVWRGEGCEGKEGGVLCGGRLRHGSQLLAGAC